jgi:SAM-dependent methyltransferase
MLQSAALNHTILGARDTRILLQQKRQYQGSFYRRNRWRWVFRDDCRYRWNRLLEFLGQVGFPLHQRTVYDIGFGTGDLLYLFPTSCRLMGVELSADAVEAMELDPRLATYADHWFGTVNPDGTLPEPPRRADIVLNSHVLEHVPDERRFLEQAVQACAPGGLLVTFVPLEEPGFDPKHVRTFTLSQLKALMSSLGLEILHIEENYNICSGPFRWADHPSRHNWPALQWLEGVRNVAMTVIPYRTTRAVEDLLAQWGVSGKQAMVVARVPARASASGVRDDLNL